MESITQACQNCPAKHVTLILDCCSSGFALTRSSEPKRPLRATSEYVTDITNRRAIQVLAAGQEDEPVSDSGTRPGYSAFTGALLNVLESENDIDENGILTCGEIGSNLELQVASQKGRYQRPLSGRIHGSEGGDLLLKIFTT